jgi:membrane-bound serine protease (ClpP class)
VAKCCYDVAMITSEFWRGIRNRGSRLAAFCLLGILALPNAFAAGKVLELDLEGPLGVATAEYIIGGIEQAAEENASLVIIRMDTPGGLVEPMRDIVRAILGSPVPVATYVSPGGARADSAGTYILLASHVAAMAPTTHLGAATPVSLGGDDMPDSRKPAPRKPTIEPPANEPAEDAAEQAGDDEATGTSEESPAESTDDSAPDGVGEREPDTAMGRKVLNDAVAYIRGLAETHGRNADWAEKAVRDAATLTATEALEQNVIDLIAEDRAALLAAIHGREVKANNRSVTLDTENAVVEQVEPSWRIKFLSTIANPQVALLLMIVGIYGLMFEGWNPGAIVPGVVGVVCLLLAAYALQIIPVNYAGLALIIVGMALIIAEAFAPSFGALGLGGIAAFIFGAIMMFDTGVPGFGISITFVVMLGLIAGSLMLWMVTYLLKLRRRGAVSGEESILGGTAVAMEAFTGDGRVWLEGEAWQAISPVAVSKDQKLRVRAIDGLRLRVEPLDRDKQ